jgi:hypothetical protein
MSSPVILVVVICNFDCTIYINFEGESHPEPAPAYISTTSMHIIQL